MPPQQALPQGSTTVGEPSVSLPVVEESFAVEKVLTDLGGYRLTKRVETNEQQVETDLHHQRVEIERQAIGQWVDQMPQTRQEGDTLIVPVAEEVLVTEKRWRLIEEVRIRHVSESSHSSQPVTLRKETIEVERLAPEGKTSDALPPHPLPR